MTPDEFDRALWANFKHREAEIRDSMRHAWCVAMLSKQQRLPPLHVWMAPKQPDADEMARLKEDHERMIREIQFGERPAR